MPFILAAAPDRLAQLSRIITIALLLVGVLFLTGLTTRWLAGFEKKRLKGRNVELLEAVSLGSRKYVQILRVGSRFYAIAVCRDSVTLLCELKEEELNSLSPGDREGGGFGALLKAAVKRMPGDKGDSSPREPVSRELEDSGNIEAGKTDL